MTNERRFQRDSGLPFQELQGQAVIVVPARRQMHRLDPVGTFLWNALREPRTADDLARSLCEEFDVEPGRAEGDVGDFLRELEEKGLVKVA